MSRRLAIFPFYLSFNSPCSIRSFIKGIARHQLERILQAYRGEVVSVIIFVFGRNVEGIFSVQVYILSQNNIPFSQPESQLLCRCSPQHRLHDKVSIIRYPQKIRVYRSQSCTSVQYVGHVQGCPCNIGSIFSTHILCGESAGPRLI